MTYLLVNDIPILEWLGKNSCPTCEQLLKAGNRVFETKDVTVIQKLKTEDLEKNEAFKFIDPILHLMPSGFYSISYDKYYPTDGDGTWSLNGLPWSNLKLNLKYRRSR